MYGTYQDIKDLYDLNSKPRTPENIRDLSFNNDPFKQPNFGEGHTVVYNILILGEAMKMRTS